MVTVNSPIKVPPPIKAPPALLTPGLLGFWTFLVISQPKNGRFSFCKKPLEGENVLSPMIAPPKVFSPRLVPLLGNSQYLCPGNLRPEKLYSTDDELRQGVFTHCRRKNIKIKIGLFPVVGGKKVCLTKMSEEKKEEKKKIVTRDSVWELSNRVQSLMTVFHG